MDFEKSLTRLEQIVSEMEEGELSLDDSLKLFEEGVKTSRSCHKSLEQAELKVQKLIEIDGKGKGQFEKFEEE